MGRRELIIVTLLFMLIVGTILFFTLMNIDEDGETFKFSITGSSTNEGRPIIQSEVKNDDIILNCNKCSN